MGDSIPRHGWAWIKREAVKHGETIHGPKDRGLCAKPAFTPQLPRRTVVGEKFLKIFNARI